MLWHLVLVFFTAGITHGVTVLDLLHWLYCINDCNWATPARGMVCCIGVPHYSLYAYLRFLGSVNV